MLYIATPPLPVPCSGSPGFFWIQPLGRFATVKTRVLWVLLTFLKVLTKPVSDMPGFAYTVSPFFYVFDISDVFRCFRVISVFSCIIRCFLCGLCNMAEYSMFYVFSVCLKLSETRVLLSKRVRQEPCQRRGFLQNWQNTEITPKTPVLACFGHVPHVKTSGRNHPFCKRCKTPKTPKLTTFRCVQLWTCSDRLSNHFRYEVARTHFWKSGHFRSPGVQSGCQKVSKRVFSCFVRNDR